jgi:hypothetical protein
MPDNPLFEEPAEGTQDATSKPAPPEPGDQRVQDIYFNTLINARLASPVEGVATPDLKLIGQAVLAKVLVDYICVTEADIDTTKSFTARELYIAMLGKFGPDVLSRDPYDIAARELLQQDLWGCTSGSITGVVQKGLEKSRMILCEKTVQRPMQNLTTGNVESGKARVRFATGTSQLILDYFCEGAGEQFKKAARRYNDKLVMVQRRQPTMALEVARQAAEKVGDARKAIPAAIPAQVSAALNSGSDEAASA